MIDIPDLVEFEWDEGNIHKSYKKHGITPNEAEEVFTDIRAIRYDDEVHSNKEIRAIVIGKNIKKQMLFIVFTVRHNKIRIISARPADNKERRLYEKINKNS